MASKLQVYNDALAYLGERKLASLSEAREPRYKLDDAWTNAVVYCLEQGAWNFAMRAIQLDSAASIEPTFGYTCAFEKPSDWVRTHVIGSNEQIDPPLLRYSDEAGYWYADCDPLYVQYVSNSESYGLDLSRWPATFTEYVAVYLARKLAPGMTASQDKMKDLFALEKKARIDARSKDGLNQAVGFPPRGSWVTSRGGGMPLSRWDR